MQTIASTPTDASAPAPWIAVSTAPTYPDPTGKMAKTGPLSAPVTVPFGEWCARLSAPVESAEKISVGCWTPIWFAGDRRIKADALAVTALVFDLDRAPKSKPGSHLTLADVGADLQRLAAGDWAWFCHSSHSNGSTHPDGALKTSWRLLAPLDEWLRRAPGEGAEHFAARAHHLAREYERRLGLECIHDLSDLGRIWFNSAVHPERRAYFRAVGELGKPSVPLAELMTGFREPKSAPPVAALDTAHLDADRVRYALTALRDTWPEARNARGVSRHAMRLGLVGILVMSGFDDETIERQVSCVYANVGDDAPNKTAEAIEHTRHCIESGANIRTWGPLDDWYLALGHRGHAVMRACREAFPEPKQERK